MAEPTSVEELGPGDHACLTFSDQEERLDIMAAFVGVGLRQGQRVVCFTEALTPSGLSAEFVERGAALGMGSGRRMTVVCLPLVNKVLRLVGIAGVPQLQVAVIHGES